MNEFYLIFWKGDKAETSIVQKSDLIYRGKKCLAKHGQLYYEAMILKSSCMCYY